MPRKVCAVVTARPSYSRIKTALSAIHQLPDLQLQLVVGGSALLDRFGETVTQIVGDGFAVDGRASFTIEGSSPTVAAKTAGLGMVELSGIFDALSPDIVLVIADRYEVLSAAAAAAYMNIPLAHVQGGEVTGSIDEKVRHAVTKLSNAHFVANERAAERVRRMGEDPAVVYVTGCPSIDLARDIQRETGLDFDPYEVYGGVGARPDLRSGYIVGMQHPVTTEHRSAREQITATLEAARRTGFPVLWFWPNIDTGADETSKGIRIFRENQELPQFHFFKSMSPEDFLRLLCNSLALVGNSSAGIREGSFLGVPTVNIGTRQNGRERGPNVLDVGHVEDEIYRALKHQMDSGRYASVSIYGDGKAGGRIARNLSEMPLAIEKRLTY